MWTFLGGNRQIIAEISEAKSIAPFTTCLPFVQLQLCKPREFLVSRTFLKPPCFLFYFYFCDAMTEKPKALTIKNHLIVISLARSSHVAIDDYVSIHWRLEYSR